jgi:hypothetical protein
MKTIYIILLFAAAFVALFEQSKEHPNKIIMVGAIVLFMIGLMRLMSKVPSKDQKKEEDEEV